jgi:hypothetical protein
MESWEGFNYYTRDTTEWSVGYLPPNVVAISDTLNDTYKFPADAIVIENAGRRGPSGFRAESFIFGAVSAFILSWAAFWIIQGIRNNSWLKPRKRGGTEQGKADLTVQDIELKFLSAREFEKRLDEYYPKFASYAEVSERNSKEMLQAEEVTAVSALLVRMFKNDTRLRALQNANRVE